MRISNKLIIAFHQWIPLLIQSLSTSGRASIICSNISRLVNVTKKLSYAVNFIKEGLHV